jgi:hypothetical protein
MEWYVEFKTWAEGEIKPPWPFVFFGEDVDYRKRINVYQKIDERKIRSIWYSFNEKACSDFLKEHVAAALLAAKINCNSVAELENELKSVFGYCEIVGCCPIDNNNISKINEIFGGDS